MNDTLSLQQVQARFDAIYSRLDAESKELIDLYPEITVQQIRGYLDSWEGLRSDVWRFRVKVLRLLLAMKEKYEDSMRLSLKGGGGMTSLSRATHFEERKAQAETENLPLFMEVRKMQQIVDEATSLLDQIKAKDRWLSQLRFEALEEEKRQMYTSNNEYSSRG